MIARRIARARVRRIAFSLAMLSSLACLLVPSEVMMKADILGLTRGLGGGEVAAADLTPVTVGNSTSAAALAAPTQRKLFRAADRFWIFYSNGADLVYRSSPDGLSWSSESAALGARTSSNGFSVHFDGSCVHYARTTSTNGEPLYYRRGVPGADGTIAWAADEQIAVAAAGSARYLYPSVSADSSGYALISYHLEKQNGHSGEGPYVAKSGNNDGTWGTAPAGFPHQLTADSESEWYTTVHGLTAGRIAVTFADHTDIPGVSIASYDGANWNALLTTPSSPQFGSGHSAVAEGDDVHIVLLATSTFDLLYYKYTYATNILGAEETLLTGATASSFPALTKDSNNDLYCFWPGAPTADHVYYRRMVSGVWEAGYTDWLTESPLIASGGLSAFYGQGGSEHVGLAWERGAASPYDIRFAAISTYVTPNQVPNQPANTSPADGAAGLSLTPTLQSSAFSDPDFGDTHGASQWQVTVVPGEYADTVFDSGTDASSLTAIVLPSLTYSTTYYWHVRHQDNRGGWSDWSAETSFSTTSAPNQVPIQPANASPADGATGLSLTPKLQSSAFFDPDVGDTHGASQWQVTVVPGEYAEAVFDSGTDASSLTAIVLPSLGYSTTYYWHVRHQDNHGEWSDWSAETSFSTTSAPNRFPNQPVGTSPANGATNLSPTLTLQSSAFSDPDAEDTHGASQWQIRLASGDYVSPAFDSQRDAVNLVSIPVPPERLGYSTTYYWRVRHQDNHGDWSDWSAETSFSTMSAPNQVPNQPANAWPANGATGVSLTTTLQSAAFSDPDVGDTHGASQWQITSAPGNYSSTVLDSGADAVNLTTIIVTPPGYSTTYYWHVRHQDNHGDWSDWSAETSFTTTSAPNQPPNQPASISPADGATGVSLTPTLQSSAFSDPDVGDTHGASQWQITSVTGNYSSTVFDSGTDAVNLTAIIVTPLGYATTYYWHVRHQDSHGDWSEWSAETSFSTTTAPNQVPNQPANVSPANGATDLSLTPMLQSAAFSDPDVGDTHGASQWQITATSGNYDAPVFDSGTDTANLISILVTPGKLGYSTTYYWRVRYQDSQGDWSEWSAETLFATASVTDEPPDDTGDEDGAPGTGGNSYLPYIVAIVLGIAVIPIVGGSFFIVHARLLSKPSGLRSAETISKRLRK